MYISYDYYRIFYYVAKYRSFTQAAAALLNNQPNITRTIKNLEEALGCTLFVRSSRGVSLTPEGEKLYAHVSIAVEQIQAGERELALDKGLQEGTVSLAVTEVALHCLLLPILKEFRALHPGIHIRISNHSTLQAIAALKNGLADFAVVTALIEDGLSPLPTDKEQRLSRVLLHEIRETAVCGPAYSFLEKEPLTLSRLVQYPLICLGTQTQTFSCYSDWFAKSGLTLSPDIEAATADQILPMVRNNLGIGFVPEQFLQNEPAASGIRQIRLTEPLPKRYLCMMKRTGRPLSIAAAELERMILEACADEPPAP